MKNLTFALLTATVATFAIATSVQAAEGNTNCQPIYGGGQTCVVSDQVKIDKKVSHPKTGAFVDNLGADLSFAPGQSVAFQLTVTNTSGSDIAKTTVKDIFPQYVSFVSGVGNFDTNSKTLTFDVLNLKKGESRNFTLSAKIAAAGEIPSESLCVVNQAQVLIDNSIKYSDNAQLCVNKAVSAPVTTKGGLKVFPPAQVTTTPSTGPEAAVLFGLIPTGILGHFLRKKSI